MDLLRKDVLLMKPGVGVCFLVDFFCNGLDSCTTLLFFEEGMALTAHEQENNLTWFRVDMMLDRVTLQTINKQPFLGSSLKS